MKIEASIDVDVEVTEEDGWMIDRAVEAAGGHRILNVLAGGIYDEIIGD